MTAVTLETHTIYLMTGFASIVGAAMLLWLHEPDRFSRLAIPSIATSILAIGGGFILLGLRGAVDVDLATGIANALLAIAALYLWIGTAQLLGQPCRTGPAAAVTAVYIVLISLLLSAAPERILGRNILASGFYLVFFGLAMRELLRSPLLRSLRAVRLMLALYVIFSLLLIVRLGALVTASMPIGVDGLAAEPPYRSLFAIGFGTIPFALAIAAQGVVHGRLDAHLRELATTDMLTGLVSRRILHEKGPDLLADSSEPIAALMIDLDNFKQVNDQYGHTTGDRVLQHLATILRSCLRPDSIIVRYGGDEFCVLVPVHDRHTAVSIAERIRASIEATPYQHGDVTLPVTISIGVSLHHSGRTMRDLLDEADRYAYDAKSLGRNRVMGGTGTMTDAAAPAVPTTTTATTTGTSH